MRTSGRYEIQSVLTNTSVNFPKLLILDRWPAGGAFPNETWGWRDGKTKWDSTRWEERIIYCNPLSDFTQEGIKAYREKHGKFAIKSDVLEKLTKYGYPYMDDLREFYNLHPEHEGKVIHKVIQNNEITTVFTRRF